MQGNVKGHGMTSSQDEVSDATWAKRLSDGMRLTSDNFGELDEDYIVMFEDLTDTDEETS